MTRIEITIEATCPDCDHTAKGYAKGAPTAGLVLDGFALTVEGYVCTRCKSGQIHLAAYEYARALHEAGDCGADPRCPFPHEGT